VNFILLGEKYSNLDHLSTKPDVRPKETLRDSLGGGPAPFQTDRLFSAVVAQLPGG
jgi:hypothetical protein